MSLQPESSLWEVDEVIDWAFREGRLLPSVERFIEHLAYHLSEAGAPVDRLSTSYQTLHPTLRANAATWTRDTGRVIPFRPPHGIEKTERFIGSPLQAVFEQRRTVRQDLTRLQPDAHRAFEELAEQSYSDYLALPVLFSTQFSAALIFATQSSTGFNEDDVSKLGKLARYLSPVLEVFAIKLLTRSLLDTYVGKRTGQKVLTGMIKRGDAQHIQAALWFSDLRDFTRLSETLPAADLLELLNSYFETVAAAVLARGGEILRFIGDAMLIVFPLEHGVDPETACESALEAAIDALESLEPLNHRRRRRGLSRIEFGVGLNIGEVIYGNVGAPDRLDFTVMGPAVNRTARLESLTKTVGKTILMSQRFAEFCRRDTHYCGEYSVKGIDGVIKVYCPA